MDSTTDPSSPSAYMPALSTLNFAVPTASMPSRHDPVQDLLAQFGSNLAVTENEVDIRRASEASSDLRRARAAKLGNKTKTAPNIFSRSSTASSSSSSSSASTPRDVANQAKTALQSLVPQQVFHLSALSSLHTALMEIADNTNVDSDELADAVDLAVQLVEHMEPTVHHQLNALLLDMFNTLWVAVFQWDSLMSKEERKTRVCNSLTEQSSLDAWRPKFNSMLAAIALPQAENDIILQLLLDKTAAVILQSRVEAVVSSLSSRAAPTTSSTSALPQPGALRADLCTTIIMHDIDALSHFLSLHSNSTSDSMLFECSRKQATLHVLKSLLSSSSSSSFASSFSSSRQCTPELLSFAAKVEEALATKGVSQSTTSSSSSINIAIIEIARMPSLLRVWAALAGQGADPHYGALSLLEIFKLMVSFVQRYVKAFIDKTSPGAGLRSAMRRRSSNADLLNLSPTSAATTLTRAAQLQRAGTLNSIPNIPLLPSSPPS